MTALRPFSRLRALALAAALVAVPLAAHAQARSRGAAAEEAAKARANANIVSIVSGTTTGTFLTIANDISFVLDDGDALRILPIVGKGAQQNLYDILRLRGVDLGIIRTDSLEELRRNPETAPLARQIVYITSLFADEAHLIARREIASIRDLAGKRVAFDLMGSGANYSGRLIFERLGIPVEAINVDQAAAQEMMRRGEIAAAFQMASRPVPSVARLSANEPFHLLDVPFDPKLEDLYLPARLTSADYPNLVKGRDVGTVAVTSVLAAYNWPAGSDRHRRVSLFVDRFFSRFDEFLKAPRHPKWREVNIAATIPGWERFKPAQDWLDRQTRSGVAGAGLATATPQDREALFRSFRDWQRRQTQ